MTTAVSDDATARRGCSGLAFLDALGHVIVNVVKATASQGTSTTGHDHPDCPVQRDSASKRRHSSTLRLPTSLPR